jgi:RNA polymerase sigma-70 factor (ECF subfamily)
MQELHAALVGRASRGDREALDALVEQHLAGLVTFVRARAGAGLRAREETMDLALSACREVLVDLEAGRELDEAHFRQWLYLAAERKIADRGRYWARERREGQRAAPVSQGAFAEAAGAGPTPSREAAGRESWAHAEDALAALPEEYREVILLSRVVGLPHAEVAERLGRSEGATRMLLARALARLARSMPRTGSGP